MASIIVSAERPEDDTLLFATGPITLPVFRDKSGLWANHKAVADAGPLSLTVRLTVQFVCWDGDTPSLWVDAHMEDDGFVKRYGMPYTDDTFLQAARQAMQAICHADDLAPFDYTEAGMQSPEYVSMEGGWGLYNYLWEAPSAHRMMSAARAQSVANQETSKKQEGAENQESPAKQGPIKDERPADTEQPSSELLSNNHLRQIVASGALWRSRMGLFDTRSEEEKSAGAA